jgi:hypothetical protein
MPGRGPTPNPNAVRRASKGRVKVPATVIDAEPQAEPLGPPLPPEYEWPQRTRDWWETWRACEMASTFMDTDWQFLLDTAPLHVAAWEGSVAAAAELRLRVGKFGSTPEDRLRLRMEAAKAPAAATPNAPKSLARGGPGPGAVRRVGRPRRPGRTPRAVP